MTILTKIKKNEDIYVRAYFGLLRVGSISHFYIEKEHYLLLTPFQAAALQKLGVELEFYESNNTLSPYFPSLPEGTKVKRKEGLEARASNPKYLEQFVAELEKEVELAKEAELERKLKGGEK